MVGVHAKDKGHEQDAVFTVLKKANEAIASLGLDKVVNASIGAIYDENEKFASLSVVDEYFRNISPEKLMSYAPIAGTAEFQKAAIEQTFQGNQPENTFVKAVATPGGTGAVRHAFYNYLNKGEKALVPDWFWGNYRTIAEENERSLDTYVMFDESYNFTLSSVKEKTVELLKTQDNLVIVFNTPAHNPTGYSMTEQDWTEALEFLKGCAEDKNKKITVLVDLAYIDYAGKPQDTRAFMKLFKNLPENILVTIAYSMSKSFLMYGLRSGALIGISSYEEVAEEFYRVNSASNRGIWSNGTRGAQEFLADVAKNPELQAKINEERNKYMDLMVQRADIFMKEAKEVGLNTLPYHSGFFITIPAKNPSSATDKLMKDHIYALALKKGIRVAICGIPTYKVPGLAAKIKKALEE